MAEPTLKQVLEGAAEEAAAPVTESLPAAGRQRQAVGGGGSSIALQVGDSFEAVYNGSTDVDGKFGVSKLYKFTLIAPAELTVVHKDADTGVKSEERKTLDTGTVVSTFMKGNGDWLLGSIQKGQDIELRRVEDGVLPKAHRFAGTAVHTYELYA